MIKPWLFLSRFRIYTAIALTLFVAILMMTIIGPCDCTPDASDLRGLLALSMLPAILGYVFGWSGVTAAPNSTITNLTNSYPRFLLTRPIPRTTILLAPMLVFIVAAALIPPLMIAIILAALKLVHPASLAHLLAIANLTPAVRALGPHPPLLAILLALDFPRRYIAGISVGLCVYAVMASQRWLVLSPNRNLQFLSLIPAVFFVAPTLLRFMNDSLVSALVLDPTSGNELTYIPSSLGIALHLAIAAAITFGCWRIMRTAEL